MKKVFFLKVKLKEVGIVRVETKHLDILKERGDVFVVDDESFTTVQNTKPNPKYVHLDYIDNVRTNKYEAGALVGFSGFFSSKERGEDLIKREAKRWLKKQAEGYTKIIDKV